MDAERNLDLHASVRPTGGSSPVSANSQHRLNVIHLPLLKWDFSQFHVTESFCWNSKVSCFLAYTSVLKPNPLLFNTNAGDYTVGQLKLLPGSRVILCPHADEFIKVMRPQDGGIPGQILKVVHDDSNKQVQHLVNENTSV